MERLEKLISGIPLLTPKITPALVGHCSFFLGSQLALLYMQMAVTKSRQLPEVSLCMPCFLTHLPYGQEGAFNSALLAVSPCLAVHDIHPSRQQPRWSPVWCCCKAVRDTWTMAWAQPGCRLSAVLYGALRKERVMEMGGRIASSKGVPGSRLFS